MASGKGRKIFRGGYFLSFSCLSCEWNACAGDDLVFCERICILHLRFRVP